MTMQCCNIRKSLLQKRLVTYNYLCDHSVSGVFMLKCSECNFENESFNSLRVHAAKRHSITSEELYVKVVLGGVKPVCKCGCRTYTKFHGQSVGHSEYIQGHSARVNNNWGLNEIALQRSLETRRKMWANGEIKSWCAGLTKADPRIASIIEKMNTPERAKKISKSLSGKKKSNEHKQKISDYMKEFWSKEENRSKQSIRRAESIKNGSITKATRVHGYFLNSKKAPKTVYYRSLFELNAILHLEADDNVLLYTYEPYRIEYLHKGLVRNYVIDLLIEYSNGKKMLVEIKPSCYLENSKNIDKFDAARKFSLENGMIFEVWTEKTHVFLSEKIQHVISKDLCNV